MGEALANEPPVRFQTLAALQKNGYSPQQVVERINRNSSEAAVRWTRQALERELNRKRRLPIGFGVGKFRGSNLTKLRLYELNREFAQLGLQSDYWFVSNELSQSAWVIDNPFLTKEFVVNFVPQRGEIESFQYFTNDRLNRRIKTSNLLEALILGQA